MKVIRNGDGMDTGAEDQGVRKFSPASVPREQAITCRGPSRIQSGVT